MNSTILRKRIRVEFPTSLVDFETEARAVPVKHLDCQKHQSIWGGLFEIPFADDHGVWGMEREGRKFGRIR